MVQTSTLPITNVEPYYGLDDVFSFIFFHPLLYVSDVIDYACSLIVILSFTFSLSDTGCIVGSIAGGNLYVPFIIPSTNPPLHNNHNTSSIGPVVRWIFSVCVNILVFLLRQAYSRSSLVVLSINSPFTFGDSTLVSPTPIVAFQSIR